MYANFFFSFPQRSGEENKTRRAPRGGAAAVDWLQNGGNATEPPRAGDNRRPPRRRRLMPEAPLGDPIGKLLAPGQVNYGLQKGELDLDTLEVNMEEDWERRGGTRLIGQTRKGRWDYETAFYGPLLQKGLL
ncbi:hypothetical protein L596_019245 [Steinernema carpocapsae]|uniref:Uncharacterized protein n=1 Tax=Steinernema carpocapsae TaxID=34508 RepID=A0A4U5MQ15_STECR|nr:hypothetical protein L596_019245 [Steinernema carpocapsae]